MKDENDKKRENVEGRTMPKYVAFLRAINVGGHIVKMQELRRLFEALGFGGVETFIASGNVIFESPEAAARLEDEIEATLHQALGYPVTTFLRALPELAETVEQLSALASTMEPDTTIYVAFLKAQPAEEAQHKLLSFQNTTDTFHFHNRELFWLSRKGFSASTFSGALLEKTLKAPATVRNATTVRKIAAKHI